jgi:hypothetical protein
VSSFDPFCSAHRLTPRDKALQARRRGPLRRRARLHGACSQRVRAAQAAPLELAPLPTARSLQHSSAAASSTLQNEDEERVQSLADLKRNVGTQRALRPSRSSAVHCVRGAIPWAQQVSAAPAGAAPAVRVFGSARHALSRSETSLRTRGAAPAPVRCLSRCSASSEEDRPAALGCRYSA